MSIGEIAVLALIVGAFVIFGVTLFWVSLGSGTATTLDERRPPPRRDDKQAHFPPDSAFGVDD